MRKLMIYIFVRSVISVKWLVLTQLFPLVQTDVSCQKHCGHRKSIMVLFGIPLSILEQAESSLAVTPTLFLIQTTKNWLLVAYWVLLVFYVLALKGLEVPLPICHGVLNFIVQFANSLLKDPVVMLGQSLVVKLLEFTLLITILILSRSESDGRVERILICTGKFLPLLRLLHYQRWLPRDHLPLLYPQR